MNEIFSTLRSTHILLMGISITVLVFAISPSEQKNYEDAIDEINQLDTFLTRLDINIYKEYVDSITHTSSIHKLYQRNSLFLEKIFDTCYASQLQGYIPIYDTSIALLKTIICWPASTGNLPVYTPLPTKYHSIEKIKQLFSQSPPVLYPVLDFDKSKTPTLRNRFEELPIFHFIGATATTMQNALHSTIHIRPELSFDSVSIFESYLRASKKPDTNATLPLLYTLKLIPFTDKNEFIRSGIFSVHIYPLSKASFSTWVAERYPNYFRSSQIDQPDVMFPALSLFWNDIRGVTILEALALLEAGKKRSEQKISLFGLQVEQKFASIASILSLFTVLLYFLITLSHVYLREIQKTEGFREEIQVYPWFPLLGRWIWPWHLLTILTCTVLPVLALFFTPIDNVPYFFKILLVVCIIISIAIPWLIVVIIHDKSQDKPQGAPSTPNVANQSAMEEYDKGNA